MRYLKVDYFDVIVENSEFIYILIDGKCGGRFALTQDQLYSYKTCPICHRTFEGDKLQYIGEAW